MTEFQTEFTSYMYVYLTCFGPLLYITACAKVATLPPSSDVAEVDMEEPAAAAEDSGGGGGLV